MTSIGKIRGINTRIGRKGISDYATQSLMFNADKLNIGAVTESGYLSKSKDVLENDLFTSLIENYEEEYKLQKYIGEDKYVYKEIMEGFLINYIKPSEYYITMREESTAKSFADVIVETVEEYETFEDDDGEDNDLKKGFIEWLKEDYRAKGEYSEKVYGKVYGKVNKNKGDTNGGN